MWRLLMVILEERHDQGKGSSVDFILIFDSHSENTAGQPMTPQVFSHHVCHCSQSPVWWIMYGPRSVRHDFSAAFCEINLSMTVHNSSDNVVSVRINTFDSTVGSLATASSVSENEMSWHDTSHPDEIKVMNDVMGTRFGMTP
ncbi:hypothetical protein OROGR_023965 [Orobanche gracilis]